MKKLCMDGNTAAAHIAYALSDVSAIYPITPSSPMAESCDEWANAGRLNVFGNKLSIVEMQSEAGAAGALHGSLSAGALSTTFTASQGLLLMIPNMYKIAGELLPCVFHVTARALATHALSIFGDHSDVMACRSTGFAMLASSNVQECMDLALVSHIASLNSSIPFMHFFDGFRTSHEINKIDVLDYDEIKSIVPFDKVEAFRARALSSVNPTQHGTAQNPDIYFQNREACNIYYDKVFDEVEKAMQKVSTLTGKHYSPFEYYGAKNAKYVVVMMGSGSETAKETIDFLNKTKSEYGLVVVHLYRPFNTKAFVNAIPKTAERVAVLDRTKESGSVGEPLVLDVMGALRKENNTNTLVVGGRYGLGGKDFVPADIISVFENLESDYPKNNFTVGIVDDVTNLSLASTTTKFEKDDTYELKFFGLGSDGTVSANKNSIKIIGDNTDKYVQGYFEYDSKKSGSLTVSHLRVSDSPIHSTYLCRSADFVACHNYSFISRYDVLEGIKDGGVVLLNTVLTKDELASHLPDTFVATIKKKNLSLYILDAVKIAGELKLGGKINIIMQTAFFKISNVINFDLACEEMKKAVKKTYGKKGDAVVNANLNAIERTISEIVKIDTSLLGEGKHFEKSKKSDDKYYQSFIKPIEERKGDELKVSAFSADGSVPTNTSKFEKRGVALTCPAWKSENCIQCGRCVASCPHASIRAYLIDDEEAKKSGLVTKPALGVKGAQYRLQVSPLDCTGCGVCANVCPARNKALEMVITSDILDNEKENHIKCENLKTVASPFGDNSPKGLQFKKPYFEFSGACAGCGETPYIKLVTQLFGEKMVIANATGCSSIYGGSAPTCPYSQNENGKGPAWANSLFEDNAEFGLGIKVAKNALNKNECVWIFGGDGWAYDIGYGGLDHLLSSNLNVNVLVLDTEVYSNTGGQASKSTPKGSTAKFAAGGKLTKKKDLGMIAISSGNAYVGSISLGADMNQAIRTLKEAEAFDGPSIIIAYAPCINHGFNLTNAQSEMKKAVDSGYFTLYRYNPKLENKLSIDSEEPTIDYIDFLKGESRYMALEKANPESARLLFESSKQDAIERRNKLKMFL